MIAKIALSGKIVNPEFDDIEPAQFSQGQWPALRPLNIGLEELMDITAKWGRQIKLVGRSWLCWNVNDDWCLLQQKPITEAG